MFEIEKDQPFAIQVLTVKNSHEYDRLDYVSDSAEEFQGIVKTIRNPEYPYCFPQSSVSAGDDVKVSLTGFPPGAKLHGLLGIQDIWSGNADKAGGGMINVSIPPNMEERLHLFTIGVDGTALTADCFVDVDDAVTVTIPAGTAVPGCEDLNKCYVPATVTVDVGDKVIWSNDDTAVHTVTSGSVVDGPDGLFDTGLLMAGNSFEYSPDTVGEIPYFCTVHPWMKGVLVVQEVENDPKDETTATGMLSDGTIVSIWTSAPTAGEMMEISIEFEDAEHVNHDMIVTQNGEEVMHDEGAHHHDGKGMHTTTALSSSDPVDVAITFPRLWC